MSLRGFICSVGVMAILLVPMAGCSDDPAASLADPPPSSTEAPADTPNGSLDPNMKGKIAVLVPEDGWEPDEEFDYASDTGLVALQTSSLSELGMTAEDYLGQIRAFFESTDGATLSETVPFTSEQFSGWQFTVETESKQTTVPSALIILLVNEDVTYDVLCMTSLIPPDPDFDACRRMSSNLVVF